ncbi:hypothetical protein, partial [Borreliella valaisiana]|uniref:hypothetical protein n=1 Tax=Borreliella valaisiana TaxID=62088 RepID=UPI001AED85EB
FFYKQTSFNISKSISELIAFLFFTLKVKIFFLNTTIKQTVLFYFFSTLYLVTILNKTSFIGLNELS